MKEKLSRRNFLKLVGGAAAAGTAVAIPAAAKQAGQQFMPYVKPPEEALPGDAIWYASTCRMCPAGCGIVVRTIDGRAKKIEGNPDYPLNRGKLCARGQAGVQALYNPDRLQNAVKQNQRGSRQFEPVYWGAAQEELLAQLEAVDASKIAFYAGTMPDHLYYLVSEWLAAIGAPAPVVYDLHAALEGRAVSLQSAEELFGFAQMPVYDIANADVILSFGANFSETWQSPAAYNKAYGEFRGQAGGRGFFIQCEPRLSATAAGADEWVPIRPGVDGLVALALGRIIIEERLGTAGTFGQVYAGMYRGVDVSTIAHASGLEEEQLRRLARILAEADRPVAIPGGYTAGQTNGYGSYQAIQALNLILSRLGRRGGVYLSQAAPAETLATAPTPNSFADVQALIEKMNAGDVEMLFVHGANPVFELPQTAGFKEALANVPFVVSFSSFVDETAVQSDLILPDNTYLESWGYQVASPGADRPAVACQQPVVRPLYDTRSTAGVILELAQAMGGAAAEALPWGSEMLFMEDVASILFGSSLNPYAANTAGEFWAAFRQHGGWWSDRPLPQEPEPVGFGNRPIIVSAPEFEGSARDYPLTLYPYPSVVMSDGRGANLPWLQETPDPMTTAAWNTWVEINPATASKLHLHNNDVVKIVSPHGEIEATVVEYPGIRPDVIGIPVGWGHEDYGRYAENRGSNPIDLLASVTDPESGALAWGATRVRIEHTDRKHTLARLEDIHGEGRESLS
ncbi:MAG: molybdopterin-dependent oxidoreductase [Chloroflexi bacterium]|nr:molybdopterin-dependent oxidoreductase [Chloroflexota bacterium]